MIPSSSIIVIAKLELDGRGHGAYQVGMAKKEKSPIKPSEPPKLVTNRIREIRETKFPKMNIAALASLAHTTQAQISRLETGERELTEDWMRRIAKALEVEPADLLETATFVNLEDEVEPYIGPVSNGIIAALKSKHLTTYRVVAISLENIGITIGSEVVFDCSEKTKSGVATGDVILASVIRKSDGKKARILRQFVAPEILTTNRSGSRNVTISLNEKILLWKSLACCSP